MPIAGRSALQRSVATLAAVDAVDGIVIVARAADRDAVAADVAAGARVRAVTVGGATRSASEHAGLEAVAGAIEHGEIDIVVVHDAARPFASVTLVTALVAAAHRWGGAIPGLPVAPGVFQGEGVSARPTDERDLRRVQTPQAFRARPLLAAHRAGASIGFDGVDTAACVARFAPELAVVVIPGETDNEKITVAADLARAERVARARHL